MARQRSKKCTYNGLNFDSITERDYYKVLELRQKNKEISDLETQKKFVLQEGFRLNDKAIKPITYSADQVYIENGKIHVTDVKGSEFTVEETFKIKFKMLKNLHRDYIYHVVIRYNGVWFDLENKEDKLKYKELKKKKKLERESKKKKQGI